MAGRPGRCNPAGFLLGLRPGAWYDGPAQFPTVVAAPRGAPVSLVGGRTMLRIAGGVLTLLLALPAAWAEDKPKDRPDTPAEQYKALVKEYQDGMQAFQKALRAAKTPADRQKAFQEYPNPDKLAPKFLELAKKNPRDPAAVDALAWVVTNSRTQGKSSPRAKALAILSKDFVESPNVASACLALGNVQSKEAESFLNAVLDKNPSTEAKAAASVGLAENMKNRIALAETLKDRPQFAQAYQNMLGKDYYDELMKLDAVKANKQAEELFDRAESKYGTVKLPGGRTVAETVKPELARLKNVGKLEIGKPAPEIQGEDLDGKQFKLSDYRGKVVLLDFWGNW
jgi:hypothetical protein